MTASGYKLGVWVNSQRGNKENMTPERKARLESFPQWVWNVIDEQWEEGFRYLKEFSEREGHCKVVSTYKTLDGFRLGGWVQKQRCNEISISPERKTRLESLEGWSWDAISEQWEKSFQCLKEFSDLEGHCRVPAKYRASNGYRLGQWVSNQRGSKETIESIFPERKARLEALPGWSWAVRNVGERINWDEWFLHLKKFVAQEGHAKIPNTYKTTRGYRLGAWVSAQRLKRNSLPNERRMLLEELPGWSWNTRDDGWEIGFRQLEKFVDREGHCRISDKYKTPDGFGLGAWVSSQHRRSSGLSAERKSRLEALPGWVWRIK